MSGYKPLEDQVGCDTLQTHQHLPSIHTAGDKDRSMWMASEEAQTRSQDRLASPRPQGKRAYRRWIFSKISLLCLTMDEAFLFMFFHLHGESVLNADVKFQFKLKLGRSLGFHL